MPKPVARKHLRRLTKRLRHLERALCPHDVLSPDTIPQLIVHHLLHLPQDERAAWEARMRRMWGGEE